MTALRRRFLSLSVATRQEEAGKESKVPSGDSRSENTHLHRHTHCFQRREGKHGRRSAALSLCLEPGRSEGSVPGRGQRLRP